MGLFAEERVLWLWNMLDTLPDLAPEMSSLLFGLLYSVMKAPRLL